MAVGGLVLLADALQGPVSAALELRDLTWAAEPAGSQGEHDAKTMAHEGNLMASVRLLGVVEGLTISGALALFLAGICVYRRKV